MQRSAPLLKTLSMHLRRKALRKEGVVTTWSALGHGMIRCELEAEVRVFRDDLVNGGHLRAGRQVEFDLYYEPDGPVAKNVTGPFGTNP